MDDMDKDEIAFRRDVGRQIIEDYQKVMDHKATTAEVVGWFAVVLSQVQKMARIRYTKDMNRLARIVAKSKKKWGK